MPCKLQEPPATEENEEAAAKAAQKARATCSDFSGAHEHAQDEERKQYRRAEAAVRRMVEPKSRSGEVTVDKEVLEKWRKKGGARKELVNLYIELGEDKDMHMHV